MTLIFAPRQLVKACLQGSAKLVARLIAAFLRESKCLLDNVAGRRVEAALDVFGQ